MEVALSRKDKQTVKKTQDRMSEVKLLSDRHNKLFIDKCMQQLGYDFTTYLISNDH